MRGPAARPLSDYELASRLSYFLWSSMPDAELMARAAAGDLAHELDPARVAQQARVVAERAERHVELLRDLVRARLAADREDLQDARAERVAQDARDLRIG